MDSNPVIANKGHVGRLQVCGHLVGQLVYVTLEGLVVALQLAVGLRVEGRRQDVCRPSAMMGHRRGRKSREVWGGVSSQHC